MLLRSPHHHNFGQQLDPSSLSAPIDIAYTYWESSNPFGAWDCWVRMCVFNIYTHVHIIIICLNPCLSIYIHIL